MLIYYLLYIIFISIIIISFILLNNNEEDIELIKEVGLFLSTLIFIFSLLLWILFDNHSSRYQFVTELSLNNSPEQINSDLYKLTWLSFDYYKTLELINYKILFDNHFPVLTNGLVPFPTKLGGPIHWFCVDIFFDTTRRFDMDYNDPVEVYWVMYGFASLKTISKLKEVSSAFNTYPDNDMWTWKTWYHLQVSDFFHATNNTFWQNFIFSIKNEYIIKWCFFGVDGISLFFIILTTFLIPICLLVSWDSITKQTKLYILLFFILEFFLVIVFTVLDVLLFYIFFESLLIPMFLIIGIWGSREKKINALYQFFLYTLLGSVLMLLSILIIYSHAGTTNIETLLTVDFSHHRQLFLWLTFFFSFAVKIPMVPLHLWLPEAHVEAPTTGSVILAGILLKLGAYGFLRFSLPLFPYASIFFSPLIFTISVISIIYTSLTTIRQIDLKKIIAYSSVAHMNFVTLGIFSLNIYSIEGAIMLMLSHGLVSSALFICVGILYDRYHTRLMKYYGGLAVTMPIFSSFFLIFTLANLGFPTTSSFIGEFLILLGAFKNNTTITFLASFSIILSCIYSIWLYNRLIFGPLVLSLNILKTNYKFIDIYRREFIILFIMVVLVFFMGIYPKIFLNALHMSITNLIKYIIFLY